MKLKIYEFGRCEKIRNCMQNIILYSQSVDLPASQQMAEHYVAAAAPASLPLSFGLSRRVPVSHTARAVGAG